jgi:hypothetical protein
MSRSLDYLKYDNYETILEVITVNQDPLSVQRRKVAFASSQLPD